MTHHTKERMRRAAEHPLLRALYLPGILIYIGQGLLLPVLPLYAAGFEISYGLIGVVLAGGALGSILGDLPAGAIFRRLGLRHTMLLGVIVSMLANMALFWAPSIVVVLLLRIVAGMAHSLYALGQHAMLASAIGLSNRGRATALFGGVFRVGSMIGPALGGLIAKEMGLRAPFLIYALIMVTALLLLTFTLRGTVTHGYQQTQVEHTPLHRALWQILRNYGRILAAAGSAQLLGQMIRTSRSVLIPLYAADVLGIDVGTIGLIVSLTSALELIMVLPAGWVMDRLGRKFAMVPCFTVQGLAMLLIPFTVSPLGLLLASAAMGISNGLGSGTMLTLGSDLAPPEQRGEFLSLWRLVGDSGMLGAPLLVGSVADLFTLSASAWIMGGAGIGAGMIFAFLVPETLTNARQILRFPMAALPVRLKRKG